MKVSFMSNISTRERIYPCKYYRQYAYVYVLYIDCLKIALN